MGARARVAFPRARILHTHDAGRLTLTCCTRTARERTRTRTHMRTHTAAYCSLNKYPTNNWIVSFDCGTGLSGERSAGAGCQVRDYRRQSAVVWVSGLGCRRLSSKMPLCGAHGINAKETRMPSTHQRQRERLIGGRHMCRQRQLLGTLACAHARAFLSPHPSLPLCV